MTLEGKVEAFAAIDKEMEIEWQKAGPALFVSLQPTLNKSVQQCPKDTGTLAGSGRIDEPVTAGDVTYCTMGYHTAYALRQHEDLTLHHPALQKGGFSKGTVSGAMAKYVHFSQAGTKAKYLEDPIREDLDIIPERFREAYGAI